MSYTIVLEFGEEKIMINYVKDFGKIEKLQKWDRQSRVHKRSTSTKDMIRDVKRFKAQFNYMDITKYL